MKKQTLVIISLVCALVLGAGSIIGLYIYDDSQMAYTVNDTLPDGQGKKATVILLAGQSNASGCSLDEYLQKNVSPEKYAEYEAGYDNVYINYFASGNNQSDGFVKCAAAGIKVQVADPVFNAKQIMEKAKECADREAKVIVFGELSVSASTCGDLFFQQTLQNSAILLS